MALEDIAEKYGVELDEKTRVFMRYVAEESARESWGFAQVAMESDAGLEHGTLDLILCNVMQGS